MDVVHRLPQLGGFSSQVLHFFSAITKTKTLYNTRCTPMCYCFNNTLTEQDGNLFKLLPLINSLLWWESKNGAEQMWNEGTADMQKERGSWEAEQNAWMMVKDVRGTFNFWVLYVLKPHLWFLVTGRLAVEIEPCNVFFYQYSLYPSLPQLLNNP